MSESAFLEQCTYKVIGDFGEYEVIYRKMIIAVENTREHATISALNWAVDKGVIKR